MKKVRVTKKFSFHMAHALGGYNGLCKHVHGHTYGLRITILGDVVGDSDDGNEGFVIDFSSLKRLVESEIIQKFDHSLVLKNGSTFQSNLVKEDSEDRVVLTPFLPTCENLLIHFVTVIKDKIPQGLLLVAVRLDETPTSYAEWYLSDQNNY